jgi:hypothetical protein
MNLPGIVLAVVAFGAASMAAWCSYKANKVEADPIGPDWGSPGTGAHIEPLTTEGKVLDLSVASMKSDQAIRDAMGKAGRLNRMAVWWALGAAVASLASAILETM